MNHRERFLAVMNGRKYDRLPVLNFGFWEETLEKWIAQGHLKPGALTAYQKQSDELQEVARALGYDYIFLKNTLVHDRAPTVISSLYPPFEEICQRRMDDGSAIWRNHYGVMEKRVPGLRSISAEADWTLKDRESWEKEFKPRLTFREDRLDRAWLDGLRAREETRELPLGVFAGSLFGQVRNMLGLVNLSYMMADDPELLDEIFETVFTLCYQVTKALLDTGIRFEWAHFWEDVCYGRGSLVSPRYFRESVGGYYARMTSLIRSYGIDVISLDCDGVIDDLLPIWLENGVNTMYPVEVGIWGGSIAPWKERYGDGVRAIGGVDKRVLSMDRAAVDRELERIRPLAELGGYIPCFDHHIPPSAEWDLTRYYFDRFREVFG